MKWVSNMNYKIGQSFIIAGVSCLLEACGGGGGTDVNPPPPPPPPVATVRQKFSNTGFTEVEIRNSFAFIVQHGDQFDIEVTVDAEYSRLVSVTQDGVRLTVQFDPAFTGDIRAQVARGIVTLPILEAIELNGSAFVDMAGFDQSFLQIVQSGSSHIEGGNCRFDFVDAALAGSSHLSLRDIAPLPAANVTSAGFTQATLNLMMGGTLTGSASGSSNISYYGSSVGQQVSTRDTATVTWIGETRN